MKLRLEDRVSPLFPQSSTSMNSINPDHMVLWEVSIEQNPCISEPVQFKPVLFKSQLYHKLDSLQQNLLSYSSESQSSETLLAGSCSLWPLGEDSSSLASSNC